MKKFFPLFLTAVLVLSALGACSKNAAPAEFPSDEITLVVPYGPGGANDKVARMIASIAQDKGFVKKPMIVTNISGAATKSGIIEVANSDPDGYTLLVHHNALITAGVLDQLPEELRWNTAFRPVAQVMETPLTFAVLADSRWQTMQELFDEVAANPGTVKFGFPGINAPQSFAFQTVVSGMAEQGTDLKAHLVYFEGGSAVKTAHFGKTVDVVPGITMDTVPEALGGMYRILSVVSESRLEALPDVPTLAEAGYPMPLESDGALRMVVWAPKDTPDDVVNRLEEILRQVCETEEWKEFIASNSAVEMFRSADEVRDVFAADEEAALKVLPLIQNENQEAKTNE